MDAGPISDFTYTEDILSRFVTLLARLETLDITTLYACHALLCLIAGCSFLLVRPSVKIAGLRWIAANFFLNDLFLLLMLQRHAWHGSAAIILSDAIILIANYCFYVGFCRVIGARPRLRWIQAAFGVSFVATSYFTLAAPNISVRWGIICGVTAPMHLLLAAQSGRHARESPARRLLATVETVMGIGAVFQTVQVFAYPTVPHATNVMTPTQSIALFLQICHLCATSLCGFLAVSERVAREADRRAMQDALPGILNRKGIERELAKRVREAHRSGRALVLALIDLDHFKQINDKHGHPAGDAALMQLAKSLTSRMRSCDRVGRFGGDEFLVLLPDASIDYARQILEGVRGEVSSLPVIPFTLSGGGTVARRNDTTEAILACADEMLYRVKRDGRNRVLIA